MTTGNAILLVTLATQLAVASSIPVTGNHLYDNTIIFHWVHWQLRHSSQLTKSSLHLVAALPTQRLPVREHQSREVFSPIGYQFCERCAGSLPLASGDSSSYVYHFIHTYIANWIKSLKKINKANDIKRRIKAINGWIAEISGWLEAY